MTIVIGAGVVVDEEFGHRDEAVCPSEIGRAASNDDGCKWTQSLDSIQAYDAGTTLAVHVSFLINFVHSSVRSGTSRYL